jgi:hypothetical protein
MTLWLFAFELLIIEGEESIDRLSEERRARLRNVLGLQPHHQ